MTGPGTPPRFAWSKRAAALAAILSALPTAHLSISSAPDPRIRVDQAGYVIDQPKIALIAGDAAGERAILRDLDSRRTVSTIAIDPAVDDPLSGERVRAIDFSALDANGRYALEIDGGAGSDPFRIGPDVYRHPLYLATRAFYGQRCGTAVDLGPAFPGLRHAACHLADATFHPSSGRSGTLRAAGGWHDAGDYGKYIVNSGIATGELLWAFEWYPDVFRALALDIPESTNQIPDLLDEVKWNLDWMLAMQDADGGVWHKLTSDRFGSFTMPEHDDGGTRYVIGTGTAPYKSSCASADFAAVMAIAARTYRPYDAGYSDRVLGAARAAFIWVSAHPDVRFRNPPGVSTGEYGDADCSDERLWAAAELYRTTGEAGFGTAARELADGFHVDAMRPQSWSSVGNLGLWAYGWASAAPADRGVQERVSRETVAAARVIAQRTSAAGWRMSLTAPDFVWGSNGVAANYGVLLLAAHRFESDAAFTTAALDNLHYLLGRNTFGVSWVTAVGSRPFLHPHHRPSGSDANEDPWPGLLSGGPLARGADPVMAKLPPLPPARRWLDEQGAYSANEIAINWQAPLVLLLAAAQHH